MPIIYGVWTDEVNVLSALLIALIAIIIVFVTLLIIILATTGFQKATDAVLAKVSINPRKENEILKKDEDAVVAVLAASIEYHRETGKDARVRSIRRIEE